MPANKTPVIRNYSVIIPVIICGLLHWYGITREHNWGGDFAAYIMQAQSIVKGQPGELIEASRITYELSSRKIAPLVYPWGFPMLLAPIYAVFGLNMLAMKSVNIFFYLLFLLLLWFGFKKKHGEINTLIIISLFAINPYFMHFANNILSDIPFLFFSTLALFLIQHTVIERRTLISGFADHIILGIIIVLAFFLRSTGFMLLLVLGIVQCINILCDSYRKYGQINIPSIRKNISENWKRYFCPYITFLLIAMLWNRFFPGGSTSYFEVFSGITLSVVKSHLVYYFRIPVDFFAGVPFRSFLYAGSLFFAIAGIRFHYKTEYHILIYGTVLFLLHIFWTDLQGIRFMFPLLPFYMAFVIAGIRAVVVRNKVPLMTWGIICMVPLLYVVFFFGIVSYSMAVKNITNNRKEMSGPYADTSQELFTYISEHIDQESVIIFFKPRVLRLFTGSPAIMINDISMIGRGDYVCLYLLEDTFEQVSTRDMQNAAQSGRAELIFENPAFHLYRLCSDELNNS